MNRTIEVVRTYCESRPFARHHGIALPVLGDTLDLEPARDGGRFGEIHAVAAPLAAPEPQLVAKVLFGDIVADARGPGVIAGRLAGLQGALERCGDPGWPEAVLGLPFFVCGALVDGSEELVALMLDLCELGYESAPFRDVQGIGSYRARSATDRVDVAARFVERAALLERVGFIHGDVHPENLMLASATGDVQIIDFDAGVVAATGDERPLTAGHPDDSMPPEVKTGDPRLPLDLDAFTPAAERWSVGSLAARLLHGAHPAFFLRAVSREALEEYASLAAHWPEIDMDGPTFTQAPALADAYAAVLPELRATPEPLRRLIAQLLAAGLDGSRRPSAEQWVEGFHAARQPPEFEDVTTDVEIVVESEQILISWQASNADYVEIPDLGVQPAEGRAAVVVDRTRKFMLTAVNAYGRTEAATPVIRAVALPRLETIELPAFPGLDLSAAISVQAPPQLPLPPPPSALPRPPDLASLRAAIPPSPTAGLRIPKGLDC